LGDVRAAQTATISPSAAVAPSFSATKSTVWVA
jgi:hypothetical protein